MGILILIDNEESFGTLLHRKNKEEVIMQFEKLQKDMIAAMKAKDKSRKDSISSLICCVNTNLR